MGILVPMPILLRLRDHKRTARGQNSWEWLRCTFRSSKNQMIRRAGRYHADEERLFSEACRVWPGEIIETSGDVKPLLISLSGAGGMIFELTK
jgi:hypothetical protein